MNVLIADDERMMRIGMEKEVSKVLPDAAIFVASNGDEAMEILTKVDISLAFLDIEMPGMNGLEIAKRLKDMQPSINIIMTTAYPNYAIKAYKLHVGGYLLKPVDAEDIREELDHLRHPLEQKTDPERLKITCFGEFRVEFGGEPLRFSRSKSREVLAYLIAKNGASASRAELCDVLWEDEEKKSQKSYIAALISDLRKSLKSVGVEDIFYHKRNEYRILVDKVDCDYLEFLKGNPEAINAYRGEFMNQYSWAEEYIWDLENA
ncbi:MAG: response regulator [Eubacterium sp.]|nr:response regulator [Eubacterium sp.]